MWAKNMVKIRVLKKISMYYLASCLSSLLQESKLYENPFTLPLIYVLKHRRRRRVQSEGYPLPSQLDLKFELGHMIKIRVWIRVGIRVKIRLQYI